LDPGWVKNQDPGSGYGMNNADHIPESLETIFWFKILKFFDADKGSWMEKIWIGSGINIPDPQHWFFSHLLRYYQCRGSGSGRFDIVLPDPVPVPTMLNCIIFVNVYFKVLLLVIN
jgi:hypothetical protein